MRAYMANNESDAALAASPRNVGFESESIKLHDGGKGNECEKAT